jgi:hypothetical protein
MIDRTRYKAWRSGPDPELHVIVYDEAEIPFGISSLGPWGRGCTDRRVPEISRRGREGVHRSPRSRDHGVGRLRLDGRLRLEAGDLVGAAVPASGGLKCQNGGMSDEDREGEVRVLLVSDCRFAGRYVRQSG